MKSSIVRSSCLQGMGVHPVDVEVNLNNGLPYYQIVGLGDSAVRESAERVKAAIRNSGLRWPDQRVTVNLSPAWLSKQGSAFDLPIALGVLQASRQLPQELQLSSWGELSLTGQIKSAPGALCLAHGLSTDDGQRIVVHPAEAAGEIRRFRMDGVYAEDLRALVDDLRSGQWTDRLGPLYETADGIPEVSHEEIPQEMNLPLTLQAAAWRACMIAVAGAHHLLMLGAAGCGKTTLARASRYLLPPLDSTELYEQALRYSAAKLSPEWQGSSLERSFRAPHFSISAAALLGGSRKYSLGEVSLADQGILFLDEISEYSPNILNLLRQPLEEHVVQRTRSGQVLRLPARFILFAAANPCSCGLLFEKEQSCTCTDGGIQRYRQKFRNPFFDRIDLFVEMQRLSGDKLGGTLQERSADPERFRVQVQEARAIQHARQGLGQISLLRLNGWLPADELREQLHCSDEVLRQAEMLSDKLKLSIRSFQKLLRVARTIADLEACESVREEHVLEAFSYRQREIYS